MRDSSLDLLLDCKTVKLKAYSGLVFSSIDFTSAKRTVHNFIGDCERKSNVEHGSCQGNVVFFEHKTESCRVRGRRINSSDMTENNSPLNNNKSSLGSNEASSTNPSQPGQPQRRLIKADLDLLYSFDTKDEDEDEDDLPVDSSKETETCFFGHICPEGTQSTPVTPWKKPL
ncbi:unnamed protein product, partial [Allacma fusca]